MKLISKKKDMSIIISLFLIIIIALVISIIVISIRPKSPKPLVFFSVCSTGPMKIIPTKESTRYKMYEFHIPLTSLGSTVPKRVHNFKEDKVYWTLVGSGSSFLQEMASKFKIDGPNFDIDNIGGYVPNTESKNPAAVTLLFMHDKQVHLLNLHIHHLIMKNNHCVFSLQHDKQAHIAPMKSSGKSHPKFTLLNRHYHTFPGDDVKIILPSSEMTLQQWSLEIYDIF